MQACSEIHGASKENKAPAVDGMWCTLVRESTPARLVRFLVNSKKCRTRVLPSVAKKGVKKFEDSSENVVRSVKILYSGSLLSKEKCKSVKSNLSMSTSKQNRKRESLKFMQGVPVPKLFSYDKLIKFIQSIDLHDNVKDTATDFCSDLDEDVVNGAYRDLEEYILVLASMYIAIDEALGSASFLLHFGSEKYHFRLAIKADGAPFGKDDEACAWLVSFLNVGKRITSQNENFLLAGANCSESHVCMQRYARQLIDSIETISVKTYNINGFDVQFSFELLPSDMKWLAFMSGELGNAAHFFYSFAAVNDTSKNIVNGSIGFCNQSEHEVASEKSSCACGSTWQPWNYENRVEVALKVAKKKEELNKSSYAESTKRKIVLDFIREQKSRNPCQACHTDRALETCPSP